MFKRNDVIIYGAHGVCKIVDIEEKSISGPIKKYYVLQPIKDQSSTIYAPTENANVLKKMRKLLTVAEIDRLIDSIPKGEVNWIENERERRELYKSILAGGDHWKLIGMLRAIYQHKQEREAYGKRLHMTDENFFRDAEQLLYNEFQYVLKLNSKEDMSKYIFTRIMKE